MVDKLNLRMERHAKPERNEMYNPSGANVVSDGQMFMSIGANWKREETNGD